MPKIGKSVLSMYLRSGCQRQLVLNLYNPKERAGHKMPHSLRDPALGLVGRAGLQWQLDRVEQLKQVCGDANVKCGPVSDSGQIQRIPLQELLASLQGGQFVVEPAFEASSDTVKQTLGIENLRDSFGIAIDISDLAPDLIQVLPGMGGLPADNLGVSEESDSLCQRILSDGSVKTLGADDPRLRLRVIDFKMSSEPGSHYFAEVTLYSIALSGWLKDKCFDDRFVVVAAPGIWAVAEDGGALSRYLEESGPSEPYDIAEVFQVVESDLELAPYEVFAGRLKRFFSRELKQMAQSPWDKLDWHVSPACSYCEFLGHPEVRPPRDVDGPGDQHCWPMGLKGDRLCQVAGMPRSGVRVLEQEFGTVAKLAAADIDSPVFRQNQSLKAQRHLFPARAQSLLSGETGLIPGAGTSATMPRWPDLHIYVFLEYDLSTAITAVFGLRAFWREPGPGQSEDRSTRQLYWNETARNGVPGFSDVRFVEERDLELERQALLEFLRDLKGIMDRAYAESTEGGGPPGSFQIYLWDDAQRRQLVRVLGRHLSAILEDPEIRGLAWLFPPPELLRNAEYESRTGPITVVAGVVAATVAAPLPYHYGLLDLARLYRVNDPRGSEVSWANRQPMSDLVPAERLYGMWDDPESQGMGGIRFAVRGKLDALSDVVRRLERDLRNRLERSVAPMLGGASDNNSDLPLSSRLWLEYNRLNVVMDELDGYVVRAMPAHEREARFRSARLTERLEGGAKQQALQSMAEATRTATVDPNSLVVYRMAETSVDFNARPGDLGYALVPDDKPELLSQSVGFLSRRHPSLRFRRRMPSGTVAQVGLSAYSIVNIDRTNGLIALRSEFRNHVREMESAGVADFRSNVTLDPVPFDASVKAVQETLAAIGGAGAPAGTDRMRDALGVSAVDQVPPVISPGAAGSSVVPAGSQFLWDGSRLAGESCIRAVPADRLALEGLGMSLNPSQWNAWEHSLTHRASLIWGPPGTGKTTTLSAVVAGALHHARREGRGLRVLLTAFTYNAMDTVLSGVMEWARKVLPPDEFRAYRVRSTRATPYDKPAAEIVDLPLGFEADDDPVQDLVNRLDGNRGITVVAALPHRLHAMATLWNSDNQDPVRGWFDLMVIDEASQLSVALSTLCVSKAADNCTFVLGGDHLQLPPIQQADPPVGLEAMVGSVYEYLHQVHQVEPQPLLVNYRSNETLVNFTKRAGYDDELKPHSPHLKLRLRGGELSRAKPANWPASLPWSEGLVELLRPNEPAVCFVYDDPTAGQSNAFEADVVSGLTKLLFDGLKQGLENSCRTDGEGYRQVGDAKHDSRSFWTDAVGIVAPHRAQISAIASRLLEVFSEGHDPNDVRGAVDTVERFQGQERDVIIASFGVGDSGVIAGEEDFLYNLNRFNVMASRARAKLVVLITRSLLDHLPNDLAVVRQSQLLKYFAETYCDNPREVALWGKTGTVRSAAMAGTG